MNTLQHRCDALKPHAGIHRGRGQGVQLTGGIAVELHEHKVPDLDVAIQVVIGTAGRTSGDIGPVVVENLGAGATGSGISHLPEIVLVKPRQAGRINTDLVYPDGRRLVVRHMYGDPETLFG